MVALNLQYDIINDTPANAGPVEANFNRLEQFINQEMVNRDGSIVMTGPLRLVGDPINQLDAATKDYVDRLVPVASMLLYGGGAAPLGGMWLLCNGAALDPVAYPELHAVIGNTYGTSGGLFKLPDLRTKMPVGAGAGFDLGAAGGSTDAVVISHNHAIDHNHGTVTTSMAEGAHTHTTPNHQHLMHHQHTGATAVDGNHMHDIFARQDPISGSTGSLGISNAGGDIVKRTTVPGSEGGNIGDHNHAFTTNWFTGATNNEGGGTTGSAGGQHSHTATVPPMTGVNTASVGVTGTGANMPPYQVINYIIKAR